MLAVQPHAEALPDKPLVKPRHEHGIIGPRVREEEIERRDVSPLRSAIEKCAEK